MEKLAKTKLYIAKVTELEDATLYEREYASLMAARREKLDSLKLKNGKLQSLAASLLLMRALKDAGLNPYTIEIEYNEYGKPYLKDTPIFFNLSHSGDYAICAISNYEVGCDIEKIERTKDKIAKKFFCNEEYQHIISQDNEQSRKELFYRYWTLKESFIKTVGLGLKLHLNSFQIILGNKISIMQDTNNKEYSFFEFSEIDGYKCSVCIENGNASLDANLISLL